MRNHDEIPPLGQPYDPGKGVLTPEEQAENAKKPSGNLDGFLSAFNSHGMQSRPGRVPTADAAVAMVKYLGSFSILGNTIYHYQDHFGRSFHTATPLHDNIVQVGFWFQYFGPSTSIYELSVDELPAIPPPGWNTAVSDHDMELAAQAYPAPSECKPKHRGIMLRPKSD
jgi:hypothetical protein